MINVAILGHGVVGSGVAEILINYKRRIEDRIGEEVNVKYILDLREFNDLTYKDKFTKDFNDILNDDEVKVVAEVMGGVNPAFDFVKQCLLKGKSVCTSNKELVAKKGAELIKTANENNASFLFEASVGGGIPVLHPMIECLGANEIKSFSGILNGTTNFILNKMIVDNMSFDDALKLAQKLGYAEKNPAADIEGHDASRKVCILATLAFSKHVYPEQVSTEGITAITLDDVEYADNFNCVIKLIGHAEKLDNGKINAYVRPTLIPRDSILSGVNGVFNAILVDGDMTGEVMFYGKGAGKEATASAVVSDMIECIKKLDTKKYLTWDDSDKDFVDNSADVSSKLYVRLHSENFELMNKQFNKLFKENIFNVKNEFKKDIAFITECELESEIKSKLSKFSSDIDIKTLHTFC